MPPGHQPGPPASRVIARTNPAGDVTTIDYDAAGRVTRETIPGVGAARYRYDKLGRIVGAQDSRYGQRTFGYDAAGQLIKVVNGVGGVTRYEYDQRGRMVKIIDPTGGVTKRTYTHLDHLASSTDPLGRATTAIYDAAGRQLSQTDPDGNITEWTHDEAGRETGMKVNGCWIVQLAPDARSRTTTIADYTHDDHEVTHTLTYSRLGQLIERVTAIDGQARTTQWDYDADGRRTALVDADGARTEYQRDMTGRISQISHSTLGDIQLAYDAAGRIREALAGNQIQTWEHVDGFSAVHTRTDPSGVSVTRITRDDSGRIVQLDGPDGITEYLYDNACQLTHAKSAAGTCSWTYDLGGRLVNEATPAGQRALDYDAAGQLVTVTEPDGTQVDYHYDGQGRRVRAASTEGTTHYSWDARGWLAKIIDQDAEGQHRTDLWVNALGELAEVDGTGLQWDIAAGTPNLIGVEATPVFQGPAGLTGIGNQWEPSGWRAARATATDDPWQVLAAASGASGGLPGGLGLTADGGVQVAGLEWMGARAYDPVARGFLSVDPLAPPVGAGWSANPYSYAGNDPLHAIDPHGLAPVTDAELQAYSESLQGPLANAAGAVGDWWSNNWEYVAPGAAIAVGVGVMATGVGGPLGAAMISGALISGGVSTGTQKYSNGSVDWATVGKETLIGGAMGGLGAGASNLTSSLLLRQSSSVRTAAATHASQSTVSRAGNGFTAMLNGNTKLAAAARIEARTSQNMQVDNLVRSVAGDTVSTMTTANASYLTDVATDSNKDFSVEGLIVANGEGLFKSTLTGTMNLGTGGFRISNDMPTSNGLGAFSRDVGTNMATDSLTNYVGWQMQDHVHGGVTSQDRTADTFNSGLTNVGSGLHQSFPSLHIHQGG
ncbi:MAG: hypothetical protein HLX51_09560 [Micrococcaceae bacterium]|nr:hypothetical protein [Micrococcaceae bacterium]